MLGTRNACPDILDFLYFLKEFRHVCFLFWCQYTHLQNIANAVGLLRSMRWELN